MKNTETATTKKRHGMSRYANISDIIAEHLKTSGKVCILDSRGELLGLLNDKERKNQA